MTAADALKVLERAVLAAPASAGQILLTSYDTQLIRAALLVATEVQTPPAVPAPIPRSLAELQKEIDEKIQKFPW